MSGNGKVVSIPRAWIQKEEYVYVFVLKEEEKQLFEILIQTLAKLKIKEDDDWFNLLKSVYSEEYGTSSK